MTVTLSFDFPDWWWKLDSHPSGSWLYMDDDLLAMVRLVCQHFPKRLFQLAHDLRNEAGLNRILAHRIARGTG